MSTTIGDVAVRIGGDVTGLHRGLKEGSKSVSDFEKSSSDKLRNFVGNLAKVGAAATAAGAAMIAGLYTKGAQSVDMMAKLARRTDGTTASLQALTRAGDLNGASQESVAKAAENLTVRLGEARRGAGQAKDELDRLGLSADELSRLDTDERFAVIADRMRELGYSAGQTGDSLRNLGINKKEIINLMMEGGDAIRDARKDVDDFGVSVSDVDAAKIEAANDAFSSIKLTIQGVANSIAVVLSPYVQELSTRFQEAARGTGGFRDEMQSALSVGIRIAGRLGDALHGLRVVFKGLELVATGFGAAVVSVFELAGKVMANFADNQIRTINMLINGLNRLPKVDIATIDPFSDSAFMQGLHNLGDTARDRVGQVRGELHDLAMQELPSQKIQQFLEDVGIRAQETAEQVVAARNSIGGFIGDDDEEGGGASAKEAEADQRRLDALKNRFMTEQELYRQHQETMALIGEEYDHRKFETEEEWHDVRAQAEEDFQRKLKNIQERGQESRQKLTVSGMTGMARSALSIMDSLTGSMDAKDRGEFNRKKRVNLGLASASLPVSVMESYKNAGGYPMGIGAATAMAAAGAKQLQQIRRANYGGGGSSGGGVSAASAASAAPPAQSNAGSGQSGGTYIMRGYDPSKFVNMGDMREMIEELWKDGAGSGRMIFE